MSQEREQLYLQHTLTQLRKAYAKLDAMIDMKDDSYKQLQKYMIDHNSDLDKVEIFNTQQTLHMIDKEGFAEVMERIQVEKLIDSPYFGAFKFSYEGEAADEAETYYIGRFGFEEEGRVKLIYDWRAPTCNMYYEFELGNAFYEAMDWRFEGEIFAKRQMKIENSELQFVLDSSLTIQDEHLQRALTEQTSEKMKTIVTSIQN